MARLGDIATVITKGTTPTSIGYNFVDQGINFIKIESISENGKLIADKFAHISDECNEKLKRSQLCENDILFSIAGAIGRTTIVTKSYLPANTNQALAIIRIPQGEIDYHFLLYALQSSSIKEQAEKQKQGVAQLNLSLQNVGDFEIPIYSKEEQNEIVNNLDRVEKIISLRKQQLSKLDELVKSRFIEMFGDPIKNTQNRPTTAFINVVKLQRGYDLPVQDRQRDGSIPVYGSNGVLDRHNVAKVRGGGVITGRSGTIGQVFYCESDYWPLNTSLFSVDTHGNNIIYLAYLLQMYDLSRFTEGTGVPTLNRNKFHNKPIINVPLELQEQFAAFVEQVDKTKLKIKQSLEKFEILKKSLMQKYFG